MYGILARLRDLDLILRVVRSSPKIVFQAGGTVSHKGPEGRKLRQVGGTTTAQGG